MWRIWFFRVRLAEHLFNMVITHIPIRHLRLLCLRFGGARIGRDSAIFRGTTVLGVDHLVIGSRTTIGFRCLLDARGGLTIGSNVVIASDTQFITGEHDFNSADFEAHLRPITVDDYVWIASRATVLPGKVIGRGAVVAACALVTNDVDPMSVVAGVPARVTAERTAELSYNPAWHPIGY